MNIDKNSSQKQTHSRMNQGQNALEGRACKIIAITSGKGGVGKTNVSLNLALALSRLKKRVCVFDADLGLANINILLGIITQFGIQHVISGEKELREVIIETSDGLQIIPGGSGIRNLADLDKDSLKKLILSFEPLIKELDYLIIDTGAGIASSVLSFVMAAHESVVVVTKEPTSLTDGYALIKVITGMGHQKKINILVNMVPSRELAKKIFEKLFQTCKKHLNIELNYLGSILIDSCLTDAVCQQKPVLTLHPEASSSHNFAVLADSISGQPTLKTGSMETVISFWIRTLKVLKAPIKMPKTFVPRKTSAPTPTIATQEKQEPIFPPAPTPTIATQEKQEPILTPAPTPTIAAQEKQGPILTPAPTPTIATQEKQEPMLRSETLNESNLKQEKEFANEVVGDTKDGATGMINKISDLIANNEFSLDDFFELGESEKSYIEKLDLFLDKYFQFLETSKVVGEDKYFVELDIDNSNKNKVEQ